LLGSVWVAFGDFSVRATLTIDIAVVVIEAL
jgi:hypothetical protein